MNTPKNVKLSASVICANFLELNKDLEELRNEGVELLHFDVMDGNFVPRLGLFPEMLSQIKTSHPLPVEVHMMNSNAEAYIPAFCQAGADMILVHIENNPHLHRTLSLIKNCGAKAGVVLNPATSLHDLEYILDDIDQIMVMAINPGIVGHKIIPGVFTKLAKLRDTLKYHPHIEVEIDGGVTFESAKSLVDAGATVLVGGSSTLFHKNDSIAGNIRKLRELLAEKQAYGQQSI